MLSTIKSSWGHETPLRDPNEENINPKLGPQSVTVLNNNKTRRFFLENLQNPNENTPEVEDLKKRRKISFKIKNSAVQNRRLVANNPTNFSANKVQQLTLKFNEIIHDQPKITRSSRRMNSIKSDLNKKPSIRPKPNRSDVKNRPSVKRRNSSKKIIRDNDDKRKTSEMSTRNSVRATIEIFERRKSESLITEKSLKPKIPEKNVTKTKDLVVKDGIRKFKILGTEKSKSSWTDLQNYFENGCTTVQNTNLNTSTDSGINNDENIHKNDVDSKLNVVDSKTTTKIHKKSLYETLNVTKTTSSTQLLKMVAEDKCVLPNNSFLWRTRSKESSTFNIYASIDYEDQQEEINKDKDNVEHEYEDTGQETNLKEELVENLYDTIEVKTEITDEDDKHKYEQLLAKTDEILKDYKSPKILKLLPDLTENSSENKDNTSNHSYELYYNQNEYENPENEDIYETLSLKSLLPTEKHENIYSELATGNSSDISPKSTQNIPKIEIENTTIAPEYEMYAIVKEPNEKNTNYECISLTNTKGDDWSSCGSNRGSILSCDQLSNSLYGRYGPESDNSASDRTESEEWIDISDFEDEIPGFVIVRDKHNKKKNANWSHKVRDQWSKSPRKVVVFEEDAVSDSNHYYESLHSDDDFDSFDSESDDESFTKINPNDSGVEMGLSRLPDTPRDGHMASGNIYGLTRLAARLRKNWSLTKNDISKSLSRMTKKKPILSEHKEKIPPPRPPPPVVTTPIEDEPKAYQNFDFGCSKPPEESKMASKSLSSNSLTRKKNWLKFRRAVSMAETSSEEPSLQIFSPNKSTFYLANEDEDIQMEKPQIIPRRRASRPQSPPPPAPTAPPTPPKPNKARSTSWYAECGLFKATDPMNLPENRENRESRSSSTCWYAEVGLYQPKDKGSTPSSSTENSGNSNKESTKITYAKCILIDRTKPDLIPKSTFYTNADQGTLDNYYNVLNQNYYNSGVQTRPQNDKMATLLRDEPLYQFYDAAVAENALNETSSDSEYDGYEEIGDSAKIEEDKVDNPQVRTSVCRLQSCRTLWCEIPEVIQSEILRTLASTQRKLQEAKFEIITSEASYLNSLNVLTDHFIPKINRDNLLNDEDKKILFGNILAVKECSGKFLNDLELCWQQSILLSGICNIIQTYCKDRFDVYIDYCANQSLSDGVLRRCKGETNPKGGKSPNLTRFGQAVNRLEGSPICQGLSLHSFLMLPMQRVTRLPLLLDAVLRRLTPSDDEFQSCQETLCSLHDLATRCNEAARLTERLTELQRLSTQLEYPPGVPVVDLVSEGSKRYLVRSGELTQLLARGSARTDELQSMKLTFGKKLTKQLLTVLLFEDWVIIAKKKSDDTLSVIHHCARSFLEISSVDNPPPSFDSSLLLFLTLLENQDRKQISLLLSCSSETEKQRWIDVFRPQKNENPNEVIYESWDCPQVQVLHFYEPIQPDEIGLKRGDVVNVDKKMKDGWYHGERLRDGVRGWFPGNYTTEIANPHLRARNLRQRYRLLAYTDEYLKNQ